MSDFNEQSARDAVTLARIVIDTYGDDDDVPSVCLAKALLAGAHERDSLRRELERWKHGTQIEGDYVCPSDLERTNLRTLADEVWRRFEAEGMWPLWLTEQLIAKIRGGKP